jgi:hypothetical protein
LEKEMNMKKMIAWILLAAVILGLAQNIADAQDADPAFSSELLSSIKMPEFTVEAIESGFTVPSETLSGPTRVTLTALPGYSSYVAFMQPADGLSPELATEMALATAKDDIPHDGWIYAGGSYAIDGNSVTFAVNLEPGIWQVAASYKSGEGDEIMTLYPLKVEGEGPPIADPEVTAIELNDTEFIGPDSPLTSGPRLFQIMNVGSAPRQLVLSRSPRAITTDDYLAAFGLDPASPVAGDEFMSQMVWVGYAAILSPGQVMWIELDLTPGNYTETSWVVDPKTEAPAALLGMVGNFEVIE